MDENINEVLLPMDENTNEVLLPVLNSFDYALRIL